MRRFLALLLSTALAMTVMTVSVGAYFGTGAAVVAGEVTLVKTGLIGSRLGFCEADFKSALCVTDFDGITVTKLPSSTEGTLILGGRRVGEGREIGRREIGNLAFIPASDQVSEARFKFKLQGYSGGEVECVMRFIDKVNYAPTASGVAAGRLTTQAEIPVFGRLTGSDPEEDELEFVIVSYPTRGRIELSDGEVGAFRYTPSDGFVGSDKFSYVVRDEYGNWSEPVTVSIRVERRMCATVYCDMVDRAEYNAAVAMTAMGVMSGSTVGDDQYFSPELTVSRAEFITMAMKCAGITPMAGLSESYFDDDSDIPTSLKGYVATAQRMGLIVGDFKDGGLVFGPNEEITRYEAAKVMAALIDADRGGDEVTAAGDERVPVWARAGVSAMCVLGVFESDEDATEVVTRADAASYLYRLINYVN